MGRAVILRWPYGLAPAQVIVGMQRPIGVTQQLTSEEDDVGLTGAQDMLGLCRFGDHAYSAGGDA
ncbi:hypothetical protein D3C79_1098850 [compost metagenome]